MKGVKCTEEKEEKKPRSKKWLWAILGVAVVGGAALALGGGGGGDGGDEPGSATSSW